MLIKLIPQESFIEVGPFFWRCRARNWSDGGLGDAQKCIEGRERSRGGAEDLPDEGEVTK